MNIRIAAVAVLSAALIAGGATAADAATPARQAPLTATASAHRTPAPAITAKASARSVRPGKSVTFTGTTSGLAKGSTVTLQELVRGRWEPLARTTVSHSDSYQVSGKLSTKGKQTLRTVDGKTASPSVTVLVS